MTALQDRITIELNAMANCLTALNTLDTDERRRALNWLNARFDDEDRRGITRTSDNPPTKPLSNQDTQHVNQREM